MYIYTSYKYCRNLVTVVLEMHGHAPCMAIWLKPHFVQLNGRSVENKVSNNTWQSYSNVRETCLRY